MYYGLEHPPRICNFSAEIADDCFVEVYITLFSNAFIKELYSMIGIIPHKMFVEALKLACN